MRQERADAMLDRGLPLPLEDYYRINRQRMPRDGESIIQIEAPGSTELATSESATPTQRPSAQILTFTERAAMRHHRTGDLHQFELALAA